MPEETKKNSQRSKNEAKEQRKRRQGRQHAAVEKKVEKAPEKTPEQTKEPEKPAYEPPGPEFYNNLKRETDEILKITEDANTKYKKKEIQSNWAKYEMPIESYEEIDEQESLGADYETLIQASFSVGGHFQFKHEKSWDVATGPTPYDKYFDINMESLNTALCTIPFYERNDIDKSVFSESDIQSMDHRATKFKRNYYNDKKYTTTELEAQEKISNMITSDNESSKYESQNDKYESQNDKFESQNDINEMNLNLEESTAESNKVDEPASLSGDEVREKELNEDSNEIFDKSSETPVKNKINTQDQSISIDKKVIENEEEDDDFDELVNNIVDKNAITETKPEVPLNQLTNMPKTIELPKAPKEYPVSQPKEPTKNPIIESPEDLEKWLDDFLDD